MLKYTRNHLKKIENFLSDQGYKIIYDKGQFRSGYCIVNNSNTVVINKFFTIEGRINALYEIIPQLELQEGLFNDNATSVLENIPQFKLTDQ